MKLEDFQPELDIVADKGFYPIGVGKCSLFKTLYLIFDSEHLSTRFMATDSLPFSFSYSKYEIVKKGYDRRDEIIWLNNQETTK